MSEQIKDSNTQPNWIVPMLPRSPMEEHRTATPLELFFDLVFVIAIAQAGAALHHSLVEGHVGQAILSYFAVFFAIWWAWMNFTWFASAYDSDDIPYRLAVFVQLTGALILAAGVQRAFEQGDFGLTTVGYVVMRLPLVAQWLRAARSDPSRRAAAHRFAIGVTACQVAWVALLLVPGVWHAIGFVVFAIAELLVPVWAERAAGTTWHPDHIAERYGLFTIIVLGESVLAMSMGIQAAVEAGEVTSNVIRIIAGGLLIIFSMWWFYFDWPMRGLLTSLRKAFIWGYGHLFVFASAAAVGAGLAVQIDHELHHANIGTIGAGAAVAIPVAIFILVLWGLHVGLLDTSTPLQKYLIPTIAFLILLTPFFGQAALWTGILLVLLLSIKLVSRYRQGTTTPR